MQQPDPVQFTEVSGGHRSDLEDGGSVFPEIVARHGAILAQRHQDVASVGGIDPDRPAFKNIHDRRLPFQPLQSFKNILAHAIASAVQFQGEVSLRRTDHIDLGLASVADQSVNTVTVASEGDLFFGLDIRGFV